MTGSRVTRLDVAQICSTMLAPTEADWRTRFVLCEINSVPHANLADIQRRQQRGELAGDVLRRHRVFTAFEAWFKGKKDMPPETWKGLMQDVGANSNFHNNIWPQFRLVCHLWAADYYLPLLAIHTCSDGPSAYVRRFLAIADAFFRYGTTTDIRRGRTIIPSISPWAVQIADLSDSDVVEARTICADRDRQNARMALAPKTLLGHRYTAP